MAKSHSIKAGPRSGKSRNDFPLFKHATGRWCKKVKGNFCYFGKVADDADGQKALAKWLEDRDDLLAGRRPQRKTDALTVVDLINRFLTHKQRQVETGELTEKTFRSLRDYTCARLVRVLGRTAAVAQLTTSDFERLREDIKGICAHDSADGDPVRSLRVPVRL